ncbi:hypothetical protein BU14_0125s0008 [Porphyra umbilicalis]|uniref:Uncharacterized protein n=1 Tax=Porphyra umbilicalis TaxID=2786 RepID=A0A1X6PB91_PORUM|nr:hypothetical protein BU14_0125s0008 [Porphyra umbilicalis]|eukprot:OSX78020.1 hypothetical protein BU14_0125s0008 [Porphyra umbilicalis]
MVRDKKGGTLRWYALSVMRAEAFKQVGARDNREAGIRQHSRNMQVNLSTTSTPVTTARALKRPNRAPPVTDQAQSPALRGKERNANAKGLRPCVLARRQSTGAVDGGHGRCGLRPRGANDDGEAAHRVAGDARWRCLCCRAAVAGANPVRLCRAVAARVRLPRAAARAHADAPRATCRHCGLRPSFFCPASSLPPPGLHCRPPPSNRGGGWGRAPPPPWRARHGPPHGPPPPPSTVRVCRPPPPRPPPMAFAPAIPLTRLASSPARPAASSHRTAAAAAAATRPPPARRARGGTPSMGGGGGGGGGGATPSPDGEFIRLEAFLKAQSVAPTGGQAKLLIRSGGVAVNGLTEIRRGRKLRGGDVVEVEAEGVQMTVAFDGEEGGGGGKTGSGGGGARPVGLTSDPFPNKSTQSSNTVLLSLCCCKLASWLVGLVLYCLTRVCAACSALCRRLMSPRRRPSWSIAVAMLNCS